MTQKKDRSTIGPKTQRSMGKSTTSSSKPTRGVSDSLKTSVGENAEGLDKMTEHSLDRIFDDYARAVGLRESDRQIERGILRAGSKEEYAQKLSQAITGLDENKRKNFTKITADKSYTKLPEKDQSASLSLESSNIVTVPEDNVPPRLRGLTQLVMDGYRTSDPEKIKEIWSEYKKQQEALGLNEAEQKDMKDILRREVGIALKEAEQGNDEILKHLMRERYARGSEQAQNDVRVAQTHRELQSGHGGVVGVERNVNSGGDTTKAKANLLKTLENLGTTMTGKDIKMLNKLAASKNKKEAADAMDALAQLLEDNGKEAASMLHRIKIINAEVPPQTMNSAKNRLQATPQWKSIKEKITNDMKKEYGDIDGEELQKKIDQAFDTEMTDAVKRFGAGLGESDNRAVARVVDDLEDRGDKYPAALGIEVHVGRGFGFEDWHNVLAHEMGHYQTHVLADALMSGLSLTRNGMHVTPTKDGSLVAISLNPQQMALVEKLKDRDFESFVADWTSVSMYETNTGTVPLADGSGSAEVDIWQIKSNQSKQNIKKTMDEAFGHSYASSYLGDFRSPTGQGVREELAEAFRLFNHPRRDEYIQSLKLSGKTDAAQYLSELMSVLEKHKDKIAGINVPAAITQGR